MKVRSSTPIIDLTNHNGQVVIASYPYQKPEIYARMHGVYWGLYAEQMVSIVPQTFETLIFREFSRCRKAYIPLEMETLETYSVWDSTEST